MIEAKFVVIAVGCYECGDRNGVLGLARSRSEADAIEAAWKKPMAWTGEVIVVDLEEPEMFQGDTE